jgi:hypothetical protein
VAGWPRDHRRVVRGAIAFAREPFYSGKHSCLALAHLSICSKKSSPSLSPEKIDYDIDAGRDAWRVCCPQKRLRSHFILSQT